MKTVSICFVMLFVQSRFVRFVQMDQKPKSDMFRNLTILYPRDATAYKPVLFQNLISRMKTHQDKSRFWQFRVRESTISLCSDRTNMRVIKICLVIRQNVCTMAMPSNNALYIQIVQRHLNREQMNEAAALELLNFAVAQSKLNDLNNATIQGLSYETSVLLYAINWHAKAIVEQRCRGKDERFKQLVNATIESKLCAASIDWDETEFQQTKDFIVSLHGMGVRNFDDRITYVSASTPEYEDH
jgi:hypothetical protein